MRLALGAVAAIVLPLLAVAAPAGATAHQPHQPPLSWTSVTVGTDQGLRALAAVSRTTAWVGGDAGGIFRTTDGGRTWADVTPPGAVEDGLLFRDIEATGSRSAVALSIGEGDANRIFRTTDAGHTWHETFRSDEPTAFYDCMDFWPGGKRGIAMSDPVDGVWRILTTADGGSSWHIASTRGLDAPGEFGFSASGTCLTVSGDRDVWLGGGGAAAKVYHSRDGGHTWTSADSTLATGDAAGVFSLGFRNPRQGITVGGDFGVTGAMSDIAAYTTDGGRTWTNSESDFSGFRETVEWLPKAPHTAIAVGPNGSDVTYDGGRTWAPFGATDTGYHVAQCASDGSCWAAGAGGAVGKLVR